MGKGDQKTKRGKIVRGTYGRTRPRKKTADPAVTQTGKKPGKAAKAGK